VSIFFKRFNHTKYDALDKMPPVDLWLTQFFQGLSQSDVGRYAILSAHSC
jgi:hypothetical protein